MMVLLENLVSVSYTHLDVYKRQGYTTDADVLKKLVDYPIVNCILEYRALAKLYSTYIDGMINCIRDDGKIHTIYTCLLYTY